MDVDKAVLDAVPGLYRRTLAAINGLAALIASCAPADEIAFAAAELADFRASFEREAGIIAGIAGLGAAIRREGRREGREERDAEITAEREAEEGPQLRLVASG